ncbi:MAG TPA: adenylate/guanylate cyclase domain-containing protein [Leptospiraceae bacterium]|nr:adenylate/guanylate cyclase domain-containing protein [Leptospiraceae bacterium]HMW03754.1 adenylate/guanylate cyclase domain-containing protein [Leptospiraceae bacterium]HMX31867.1 adenylate/guanylate cyclase domain-containing protein [Leptospiraceae bacterium]HMY29734.1 adenylate/guanylate cyclase domain-containing protein [Leptospiraceae bacterium]HMZ62867.1 adenylate/guanylate cyclase domain-containing protein [Leptospiraceae bacterium]
MSRRRYILYALAYITIPVLTNMVIAAFSYTVLVSFFMTREEFQVVSQVGESGDVTSLIFSYASFVIPTAIGYAYNLPLIFYMFKKERPPMSIKIQSIIVNLPIVNATVSFAGWGLALCGTFTYFYNYDVYISLQASLKLICFNILMANLCFVFVYYLVDIVNKRFILLVLKGQNLSSIPKTVKISIRGRFFIFFLTVAVTPCLLLIGLILSILSENQISRDYTHVGYIFIGIILTGVILTLFISNSFANPILDLQKATEKLQSGDLDSRVSVYTNDEIGFLGENFNHMSSSIKEKEFIKDTFGKLVDPTVRDFLLEGNMTLGGETKDVTVLFVDIRGFTSISEKLPPKLIVNWLNQYFEQMSNSISKEKGLVNKFIGDAILAVFGTPIPLENHADSALRAALDMRNQVKLLSEKFSKEGLPEIKIGIGIHSGKVLAGNIGSMNRLEYTVIGDTVNLASRLESYCKTANRDLLLTEATKELIQGNFSFEFIDKIKVRGRESEISIFSA